MNTNIILQLYRQTKQAEELNRWLAEGNHNIYIDGLMASGKAVMAALCAHHGPHLMVANDRETAAYLYHDLTQLLGEKPVFFLPSSYKRSAENGEQDAQNILMRTEALSMILSGNEPNLYIVTYPEALTEKVISAQQLNDNTLKISVGDRLDISFTIDVLNEYHFERVDFVFEPGQYAVRGSIIDIYSFSDENPFRLDFFGDEVDSIRSFDLESQLSKEKLPQIVIVPNINDQQRMKDTMPLSLALPEKCCIWIDSPAFVTEKMDETVARIEQYKMVHSEEHAVNRDFFCNGAEWIHHLKSQTILVYGTKNELKSQKEITFKLAPQPVFHKNFDLLESDLLNHLQEGYDIYILSDNPKQLDRLKAILVDRGAGIQYNEINHALHEGFIDHGARLCFYTDHQIFERYHKFTLRTDNTRIAQQSISLKELSKLNPGDYVVHIDHGIGKFGGLVRTEVNGKPQEAIRLIYRDNDVLLVSIHALHRISKYKSKDSTPPNVNKLGTGAWQKLKEKTKSKVKDIARELIALYAQRKAEPGFAFSADSYMQTELEASFIYEDTPDQYKATQALKVDMENPSPMDRLVCGDVGFGKTEIAIRAAFKAVADNKQVAVLVPTTILAFQHYNTFRERLAEFPCNIDYVSRLRKPKEIKEALKNLEEGKTDIIIGTHRMVAKDVKFKDLGLLIIDEEQRFGVGVKEKLRAIRVNVDTLTLTATPIPRTLQFSLMGARDLSILNTPPNNRLPIVTEVHTFNEEIIKEAILFETQRNGQVFIINNRIQSIFELEKLINRLLPNIKTVVAHGQMDGAQLEKVMLDFIAGEFDVLMATTIIESGLDIPNANTIIINNAHQFGLSELHQLRGRVGRSNKKAFCYLLAPPLTTLTQEARRRLKIIEEFSDLGSGFNIAMQDLDIRGAGDVLGGEQSGFISDIGYETYQRILNEAILELKETEYKDVFQEELSKNENKAFVSDCQIETDEEMRFPDEYINNIAERMHLYRELDNVETEEALQTFESNLVDRFGSIPEAGRRLFQIVRIRRVAKALGLEKIVFKNQQLYLYFVSNKESWFYQSPVFMQILQWLQGNPKRARMTEGRDKLYITIKPVGSTTEVQQIIDGIHRQVYEQQ
ncbi:MAG: transcription-repair coupling factor [Breznakibacter sp.]